MSEINRILKLAGVKTLAEQYEDYAYLNPPKHAKFHADHNDWLHDVTKYFGQVEMSGYNIPVDNRNINAFKNSDGKTVGVFDQKNNIGWSDKSLYLNTTQGSKAVYESIKLNHDPNKKMLIVVSDTSPTETLKFKDVFKNNGFKYNGSQWIIPDTELNHAKNIVSTVNKADYIVNSLEELEVMAAEYDHALKSLIGTYIDSLAKETDERAMSQEVQRYLNFFASFHQYSALNKILVFIQKPNATRVASFDDWKKIGRKVKSGAKGIKVRVPNFKPGMNPKYNKDATGERPVYYTIGNVFDISDTVAVSARGEVPETPVWWSSNETSETIEMLFGYVTKAAESESIRITRDDSNRGEKGYSAGGHINLSKDVEGLGVLSTMVHEYGHELMHHRGGKFYIGADNLSNKELKELQAESISYVVLKHYDLPVPHQSTYLALWNASGESIRKNIDVISNVSHHIIKQIDRQAGRDEGDDDSDDTGAKVESIVREMIG